MKCLSERDERLLYLRLKSGNESEKASKQSKEETKRELRLVRYLKVTVPRTVNLLYSRINVEMKREEWGELRQRGTEEHREIGMHIH